MGLRTKSDWQNVPKQGNVPGLTPKQEDMATARSPLAGQDMNQPKPKEQGNVASVQQQEQAGIEKQKKEAQGVTSQQAQQQQQSGVGQAVEQVATKMGNFAHSLRARVNQLLTGAAQTTGIGQATSTFGPGGALTVKEGAEDISSVVAEKKRQQELLRSTMTPFATQVGDRLQAKTFGQVVKDQLGDDPEVTRMLQMVTAMQDLDARGLKGSPEARALEAQLQEMDKFGMVTQLRDAMNEYNRMMGLGKEEDTARWYGGDTEGYSAADLLSISENELRTEIEKAKSFSSGLFSGDFEENLKKKFDTESAEAQAAARRAEKLHGELYSAFQTFAQETGGEFMKAKDAIENQFKIASGGIEAALATTKEGKEAIQWLDLLGGAEGETFMQTLQSALRNPNSGLAKEQRAMIEDFLAKTVEGVPGGMLAYWMDTLGKTGKVPIKGADGKYTMVEPSGDQKLQILNLMEDKSIPPEQKSAKMKELVRSIGTDLQTNIGTTVDKALDTAKNTGSTTAALAVFSTSLVQSLNTFARSRSEDAVRWALASKFPGDERYTVDGWDKLDPEQKGLLMREVLRNDPELVKKVKDQISTKQETDNVNARAQIQATRTQANDSLKALANEATFDKDGNLVIDPDPSKQTSMAKQKLTIDAVPKNLVNLSTTKLRDAMVNIDPSRVNQYTQQIASNPWVQNAVNKGLAPANFAASAGKMFAYQQTMLAIAKQYPDIVKSVWPPGVPLEPTTRNVNGRPITYDLTDYLMGSVGKGPEVTNLGPDQIVKVIESRMGQLFDANGNPSEKLMSTMQAQTDNLIGIAERYRKDPNSINLSSLPVGQQGLIPQLVNWLNQRDTLNKNITSAKDTYAKITAEQAKLDEFEKQLDIPLFNPDEVISGVLGLSESMEDIFSGRIPEQITDAVGKITPEDVLALLPTLQDLIGKGTDIKSLTPDQLQSLMTKMKTEAPTKLAPPGTVLPSTGASAGGAAMPAGSTAGTTPTTMDKGIDTGGIDQKLIDALKMLGMDITGWSIKGGIPHLRMGEGQYVPVEKLQKMVEAMPRYSAPASVENVNVNVPGSGFDPISSQLDLSDWKLSGARGGSTVATPSNAAINADANHLAGWLHNASVNPLSAINDKFSALNVPGHKMTEAAARETLSQLRGLKDVGSPMEAVHKALALGVSPAGKAVESLAKDLVAPIRDTEDLLKGKTPKTVKKTAKKVRKALKKLDPTSW